MKRVGIDTNILIRLFVDDDPDQRDRLDAFGRRLNHDILGFVTVTTLLEFDWALRSQYGYRRHDSAAAIQKVLRIRGVEVESHHAVVRSIKLVEANNVDFADALIANCALDAGCDHVVTLDKKAASRVPGMELLT